MLFCHVRILGVWSPLDMTKVNFMDSIVSEYVEQLRNEQSSSELFQQAAHFQVSGTISGDHPPEVRTVVPYLYVAEFVDDDIVKAGRRHFDQIEGQGNTLGMIGIAAPAGLHRADGDWW